MNHATTGLTPQERELFRRLTEATARRHTERQEQSVFYRYRAPIGAVGLVLLVIGAVVVIGLIASGVTDPSPYKEYGLYAILGLSLVLGVAAREAYDTKAAVLRAISYAIMVPALAVIIFAIASSLLSS